MVVRSLKGSVCFSFSFMYPPTVHTTAVLKTPSASLWMTSSLEIMLLLGFDCWDMSLFWSLLWSIISCHSYCVGKWFSNNVWRPKSFRFLVICEELPLNLRFVCLHGTAGMGWEGVALSLRFRIRFVPLQHRPGAGGGGAEGGGRNVKRRKMHLKA